MSETQPLRRILFVCQHGAFRSRIAAAYFNAVAPPGWLADSAGVTPQSRVSERLAPVLAGTAAEGYRDDEPPRAAADAHADRVVAIDTEVPGAESWSTADEAGSDDEIREAISRRVGELVERLATRPAV